jgi:hypothetical protein
MIENFKHLVALSLATLIAYFQPVQNLFIALIVLILLNFALGLIAGLVARKETFQFRKAFRTVWEATSCFLLIAAVFFIGDHLGARGELIQALSTLVYAIAYFYAVNICRNLQQLFPGSRIMAFVYYLLSVELLTKLPQLNRFLTTHRHDADIPR